MKACEMAASETGNSASKRLAWLTLELAVSRVGSVWLQNE